MKAILIARVSTEEQREAGNSLPAQIVRLERYCNNKSFSILKTCSFDESAYKSERHEFDRIIDFILEQKEKVAICCDKVDRLSRNIFDKRISLLYERALNDEIELHFVSDGQVINSKISATEKFQFSISLGLAKYYSDAVSDNVTRALEQKVRKGEWVSKAPYGYKNVTNAQGVNDVVVDEFEAHIVKKVFDLYASGAYSMELLCKKLKNEHDINWPKGSLGAILCNPFYYGVMRVKGQEHPHRYPPLISQAVFEKVREIKDGFQKKPYKYAGKPYIYRGLIRCAHCGCAITPEKHKGFVYYHCTQYHGKHGAKWLREEEITRQLGKVFESLRVPETILEQIIETLNATQKEKAEFHKREFEKLDREQKTLTTMMDNLYMDKLKGSITENDYDRFFQSFRNKMTDVTIRLENLQQAEDNYAITAKLLLDLAIQAFDLFMSSEVEEKRQLLKLVLSNLVLEDENLRWIVNRPFDVLVKSSDRQIWSGWPDSNWQPLAPKASALPIALHPVQRFEFKI